MSTFTKEEGIIVGILQEHGAYSQPNSITPKELIARCANQGLSDKAVIENAIIHLIDNDVIEYEMDENNQASELWLLEE